MYLLRLIIYGCTFFITGITFCFGQRSTDEPKPSKRISEYRKDFENDPKKSDSITLTSKKDYIHYLRLADDAFDKGMYREARAAYRSYVDSLDGEQLFRLGWIYFESGNTEEGFRIALRLFKLAADSNIAGAYYYIGLIYSHGYGVAQDTKTARDSYSIAADMGYSEAMDQMGLNDEFFHKSKEAVEWYRKAAAFGNSNGLTNLGILYSDGKWVKKNYDSAMKCWHDAASLGNERAMFNLGNTFYITYNGVKKNYDSAVFWYSAAVKGGDFYSATNLGYMYQEGQGVNQDYERALKLYLYAAEGGDRLAMRHIGDMYKKGLGVNVDKDKANYWHTMAATVPGSSRYPLAIKIDQ